MLAALYALSMAVLLVYGLNLLWLAVAYARRARRAPERVQKAEAVPVLRGSWPVVTVQLPVYNEVYVVERLIDACAALDYPPGRLEIQVLDDSTDETTALAARRVRFWRARGRDIVLIHRSERAAFKAGALQNGLQRARGTCIAIFDADFVPPPDFLRRMVPCLLEPGVGMVQARWGHANAEASLLTRIQAFGLDMHFAVEQFVRSRAGYFFNFNGTAGIWRRTCIEEAGGWQGDTLTEDFDLSYRAQLLGWTFRYLPEVEVPAELPAGIHALRTQQFRWTKGAVETARKLLGRLWRADQPRRIKVEGTLHLTAHAVFPFILLAALLHAPLLLLSQLGYGPGAAFFALMGIGLLGFGGVFLAQLFAQRALYPDWGRRLRLFPFFVAGSMGIALSNTRAVWQALRGKRTAFVRTPKQGGGAAPAGRAKEGYAGAGFPPVAWGEGLMMLYCLAGLGMLAAVGAWAALPFQALFALGFGLVTMSNLQQCRQVRLGRGGGIR